MPGSPPTTLQESAATEAMLLAAIQSGDERAFLSVYDRYSKQIFALLLRILRNQEDAEDVLQAVFLQVWNKAGSFDPARCRLFTWLVMIARNRGIDRLRQRTRHARTLISDPDELAREIPLEASASNSEVDLGDDRAILLTALGQIPPEQRRPIEMAFFQGMSQAEISETLAEPLGTIKARIRRGMLRLREYLARRV